MTPSCDNPDKKVHLTPANLSSFLHRAIEAEATHKAYRKIFADESHFVVHPPLPYDVPFSDEGSANHMLLCPQYGQAGIHIFVYGRSVFASPELNPKKFPARQTLEAVKAIARNHKIFESFTKFFRQNPEAIDQGVFHNDVIAVANLNVLFCHEKAFVNQKEELENLKAAFETLCADTLKVVMVKESDLSIADTVQSYLFNSQLVYLPDGSQCLISPTECRDMTNVNDLLTAMVKDPNNPISKLRFIDLHESMANGGGPACVRFRVVLTPDEMAAVHQPVLFTDELHGQLSHWVKKHYRDTLSEQDLADPQLYKESCAALDELTQILKLGSLYPFQNV